MRQGRGKYVYCPRNCRNCRSLKTEWVPASGYRSAAEAKADVLRYLTLYYNRTRPHSYNAYVPPAIREAQAA